VDIVRFLGIHLAQRDARPARALRHGKAVEAVKAASPNTREIQHARIIIAGRYGVTRQAKSRRR